MVVVLKQLKLKNEEEIENICDYESYEEMYNLLTEKQFYEISNGYVAKEDVGYFINQYKEVRISYEEYSPEDLSSFNMIWGNFNTKEEIEKIVSENGLFIFEKYVMEE